jgi:hypothetical protein
MDDEAFRRPIGAPAANRLKQFEQAWSAVRIEARKNMACLS